MRWNRALFLCVLGTTPNAAALSIEPVTSQLELEVGKPAALAFRISEPVEAELSFSARSSHPWVVAPAGKLVFLAAREIGFLFLDPNGIGEAGISVEPFGSKASCHVVVVPDRSRPAVFISTPYQGAHVWGRFEAVARALDVTGVRIEWTMDGELLKAADDVSELAIELDTAGREGLHRLVARAIDDSGNEATDERLVRFLTKPAQEGDIVSVEAEDLGPPEPIGDFVPEPPVVESRSGASGGRVAAQYGTVHVAQVPLAVARRGWYQVMLEGAADFYLAAPSLALYVDGSAVPVGAGPIPAAGRFGRFALGAPFPLEAAPAHRLSLVFYNDMYDPETGLDRNLRLDRIEVRRLRDDLNADLAGPACFLLFPRDGDEIGGICPVVAQAFDDPGDPVTEMRLEVDGRMLHAKPGAIFSHFLAADLLAPGRHRVRVVAVDSNGNEGKSTEASIVRRLAAPGRTPEFHALAARDATGTLAERRSDLSSPGGESWGLFGEGSIVRFPVDVTDPGDYDVELVARADLFEGPPIARIGVAGSRTAELVVAGPHYEVVTGAAIPLDAGKNVVEVSFTNDRYAGSPDTDRNLHVAGLVLWKKDADHEPPAVEIVWPPPEAELAGTEMIVVRTADASAVERVELLCDRGDSAPLADQDVVSVSGAGGLTGLWLHAGEVEPGRRLIVVRAVDRYGNEAATDPIAVHVSPRTPRLSATERAIHLLRRAGLGASREDVARVLAQGVDRWVESQLLRAPPAGLDPMDPLFLALLRQSPYNATGLRWGALARGLFTPRPVHERVSLFVENHFSTWIGKTDAWREWFEHMALRDLALGSFRDLLAASATSPAMITYLDNERNRKGAINENLAREILELHTLGVNGGYDQADVEELARVLTGWTASIGYPWYETAFDRAHHDSGAKEFLGVRIGGRDAYAEFARVLAVLAAHPSTARFVATKIVRWLAADVPPRALVDRAAHAFLASGGNMAAVIRSVLTADEFFARELYGAKVKDPIEFALDVYRRPIQSLDLPALDAWTARAGQPLFGSITPDGYPEEGDAWISSGSLVARWNLAEASARHLSIRIVAGPPGPHRNFDRLSDDLAMSFLGRDLPEPLREAAARAFEGVDLETDDAAVRALAALLMQSPEFQRH